jgi:dTDP-4-dehydrorhamnose reductase
VRIYLTGGTGFVGSNVVRVFAERHGGEMLSSTRETRLPERALCDWENVELLDRDAVVRSIAAFRPDAIVHTAILNDFAKLYSDRRLSWDSYVGATRNVVEAANETGALVVLVSSDWVFDGTRPCASEDAPPHPINLYGFLKAASELVVTERAVNGAVARTSGVQGIHWARPRTPREQDAGFGYLVATLVERLQAGRRFTLWQGDNLNEVASPILASDLAELLWRIVDRNERGIFHCCGGEAVSRRELALRAVEAFDLDSDLLAFGPPELDEVFPDRVPYDTSLGTDATAAALGVELPSIGLLLRGLKSEFETGDLSADGLQPAGSPPG